MATIVKFTIACCIYFAVPRMTNLCQSEISPANSTANRETAHKDAPQVPITSHVMCHIKLQHADCSKRNILSTSITDLSNRGVTKETVWLDLSYNMLRQIKNNSFLWLPRLLYLNISFNQYLHEVEIGAFAGLELLLELRLENNENMNMFADEIFLKNPNLQHLSLKNWQLKSRSLNWKERKQFLFLTFLWSLGNNITSLDLTEINFQSLTSIFVDIKPPMFKQFSTKPVKRLNLSRNLIITVRVGVFTNLPYLECLNLSHNMIMGGDWQAVAFVELREMKFLTRLDISYQSFVSIKYKTKKVHNNTSKENKILDYDLNDFNVYDDGIEEHFQGGDFSDINVSANELAMSGQEIVFLPPNLTVLNLAHSRFPVNQQWTNIYVGPNNQLKELNMEDLYIPFNYDGVLEYFPHLEYINLNNARFIFTNAAVFSNLSRIETALLSNYNLHYIFIADGSWSRFNRSGRIKSLKNLDISRNKLEYIPDYFYLPFPNLERLNLSFNNLRDVTINVSICQHISLLDLSNNSISHLARNVLSDWAIASNQGRNFIVNLTGNDILCTCSDIMNIRPVLLSKVSIIGLTCRMQIATPAVPVNIQNISILLDGCSEDLFVTQCVFRLYCLFIFITIAANIMYRYRHSLLYFWYYMKYRAYDQDKVSNLTNITHDIYFACHTNDILKIMDLFEALEGKFHYKCYIIERDSIANTTMVENITRAFTKSQNVILVISRAFLSWSFSQFTLHTARDRNDRRWNKVICMFLGKPYSLLYGHDGCHADVLHYLKATSSAFIWPPKKEERKLFWAKLQQELGPPMKVQPSPLFLG